MGQSLPEGISDVTTFTQSRLKGVGLAILGAVIVAGCVALAIYAPQMTKRDPSFVQFMGWVGIIFFGACWIIAIRKLLFDRRPVLVLSNNGIHLARSLSGWHFIPWADLTGAGIGKFSSQRFIAFGTSDPMAYARSGNAVQNWLAEKNISTFGTNLTLSSVAFSTSLEDVLAQVTAYHTRYMPTDAARDGQTA